MADKEARRDEKKGITNEEKNVAAARAKGRRK
jgi:hypothetical protein